MHALDGAKQVTNSVACPVDMSLFLPWLRGLHLRVGCGPEFMDLQHPHTEVRSWSRYRIASCRVAFTQLESGGGGKRFPLFSSSSVSVGGRVGAPNPFPSPHVCSPLQPRLRSCATEMHACPPSSFLDVGDVGPGGRTNGPHVALVPTWVGIVGFGRAGVCWVNRVVSA